MLQFLNAAQKVTEIERPKPSSLLQRVASSPVSMLIEKVHIHSSCEFGVRSTGLSIRTQMQEFLWRMIPQTFPVQTQQSAKRKKAWNNCVLKLQSGQGFKVTARTTNRKPSYSSSRTIFHIVNNISSILRLLRGVYRHRSSLDQKPSGLILLSVGLCVATVPKTFSNETTSNPVSHRKGGVTLR